MNSSRITAIVLVVLTSTAVSTEGVDLFAQQRFGKIDARYAPLPSFSLVCYPDDPLKTAVTDRGDLAYDFGPGPYAQPLTRIGLALSTDSVITLHQDLEDPRVPVVRTLLKGRTGQIRMKAFSAGGRWPPESVRSNEKRWRRIGGENGCVAWAAPMGHVLPEMRSVAWGTNRPILYRVSVPQGESRRVGLGFCESYKRSSKSRLLEARVEGSAPLTVDPMPGGRQNEPVVVLLEGADINKDNEISIEIHPSPSGPDPNVILNAIWIFPSGSSVTVEDILGGKGSDMAELTIPCGEEGIPGVLPSRVDVLTADILGEDLVPCLQIRSRRHLAYDRNSELLRGEAGFYLRLKPSPTEARTVPGGMDLLLPKGTRQVAGFVRFTRDLPTAMPPVPDPVALERATRAWWLDSARVLYGRISVPDPGIQYLIDAGLRTMYQVRDRVDGALQFQPGPSVYRGLWVGDLGVPWITALLLGDSHATREYLDVILSKQGPDGQLRVMTPVPSLLETPMLLFGVGQYARATGDTAWLRERFPAVVSGVTWIRQMRERSLRDAGAAHAGLFPPGFVDGGISTPATDYGTVFWAIIGVENAIHAADMLGRYREASEWRGLIEEFLPSLHSAILRDSRPDSAGSLLLPVTAGNTVPGPPQRGMASQVFPVPFGEIYERDTLLQRTVRGSLNCVDRRQEQGVPVGVGWLAEGLWPSWFGPFAAIAHTLYGDPARAVTLLYAIANHATGAGSWAEEQLPSRMGPGTGGDMANAQSAAAFVLGIRWLIARERASDLELFRFIPARWLSPGSLVELRRNSGRFGEFSLRCEVDTSGQTAALTIMAPKGGDSPGSVRLFTSSFREAGFTLADGKPISEWLEIPWGTSRSLILRR